MSWLSENVFNPIENVGSALAHGDITGGKYQASGSDWLKSGLDVAAIGGLGLGAAGLAGAGPLAGVLGGGGAAGGALPSFGDLGLTADAGSAWGAGAAENPLSAFAADISGGTAIPGGGAGGTPGGLESVLGPYTGGDAPPGFTPPADASTGSLGAGGGSGGNWLDTLTSPSQWTLGGVGKGVGVAAAAGGLGLNLLKGNSTSAAQNQISNDASFLQKQAAPLLAESNQLRSYLENGNLPPAIQAQVDQANKAAKATIIANAAKSGGSTDPTQNTQLAQDLAAADRNALIAAGTLETNLFTAGQQLLSTGLNTAQLSAQLYTTLANMDRQDTQDLTKAIALFAGSLGGGGVNLNIGGAQKAAA